MMYHIYTFVHYLCTFKIFLVETNLPNRTINFKSVYSNINIF